SRELRPRYLITGIARRCARAESGHATAEPPSRAMNARRLLSSRGCPPRFGGSHELLYLTVTLLPRPGLPRQIPMRPPDYRAHRELRSPGHAERRPDLALDSATTSAAGGEAVAWAKDGQVWPFWVSLTMTLSGMENVASIQHAAKIVVGMPRFTDNTLCLD